MLKIIIIRDITGESVERPLIRQRDTTLAPIGFVVFALSNRSCFAIDVKNFSQTIWELLWYRSITTECVRHFVRDDFLARLCSSLYSSFDLFGLKHSQSN